MKKYFFMFALAAISCSEDNSRDPIGCLTGVSKITGERSIIRCSTEREYKAGSNTKAGGTAYWDEYTDHEWGKCGSCK